MFVGFCSLIFFYGRRLVNICYFKPHRKRKQNIKQSNISAGWLYGLVGIKEILKEKKKKLWAFCIQKKRGKKKKQLCISGALLSCVFFGVFVLFCFSFHFGCCLLGQKKGKITKRETKRLDGIDKPRLNGERRGGEGGEKGLCAVTARPEAAPLRSAPHRALRPARPAVPGRRSRDALRAAGAPWRCQAGFPNGWNGDASSEEATPPL